MDKYGMFADTHDTPRVDSRFVAQFFEKEHKNVLRDVDALRKPESAFFSRIRSAQF